MNRRQPHKLYSENVGWRTQRLQVAGHWTECDLGISKYSTDNNVHLHHTNSFQFILSVQAMSLVLQVQSTNTNRTRWPAWSNCLGLAVGRERAAVKVVVNKGTLRVNCPASEWPLPLVHSYEQERVIIFLSEVNSPSWSSCSKNEVQYSSGWAEKLVGSILNTGWFCRLVW